MIQSLENFYSESGALIKAFEAFMGANGAGEVALPDHLCYKCGSSEEFEVMRRLFESQSRFVYQSIISLRRIAYIGLAPAIETAFGPLRYLELSDQKPDGSQKSGFDHIELFPKAGSYGDLVAFFEEKGVDAQKVERPHHTTFDIRLPEGFLIRLEEGPLAEKIARAEMQ